MKTIQNILIFAVILALPFGYVRNLAFFFAADFEEPYKAEILRGMGVFMPPMGVFMGYVPIRD